MKSLLNTIVILMLGSATLAEADVLKPVDGRPITGEVSLNKNGRYSVKLSGGGTVEYAANDVASVEFTPALSVQYADKLRNAKPGDAGSLFGIAQWCAANGMMSEAKSQLRAVLAIHPDHELARLGLGYEKFQGQWMTETEIMTAKGFVLHEGKWVTPSEREWMQALSNARVQDAELDRLLRCALPSDPQTLQRIGQLLAQSAVEERQSALVAGLRSDDKAFRAWCAREMGAATEQREQIFNKLVDVALLDANRSVRLAAVEGLQRLTRDSQVSAEQPFIQAMSDERSAVRIAAADALGMVGGSGAVEILFSAYRMTWGRGARNHIAVVRQHAYIEDYDVQIATLAAIADPVIGVIQDGVVLDVQPLQTNHLIFTVERNVIRDAFKKLTNMNLPGNLNGADAWWAENRNKMLMGEK